MSALPVSRPDQRTADTHSGLVVAGSDIRLDHPEYGTHSDSVEPGSTSPQAISPAHPNLRTPAESTTWNGSAATNTPTTPSTPPSLADPFLALAADVLDDTEANRKANENRLRQLTRSEADSDGEERGFGLDLSHKAVAQLASLVQMMKCDSKAVTGLGLVKPKKERGKPCCFEHTAETNLTRMLSAHPLGPWVKAQKGIGDKQAARLLAVIGDPYINEQTNEPRTVSQLWAYCGHGDPQRRKFKGMTQADLFTLGNPTAKSRTWLIACAVLKSQGQLSTVYYDRKAATEGRLHARTCVRCGPSGKPAPEGSPWSDAHRHADALRVTGKEILKGLWLEAKRIHEGEQV